jgi:6,7-dimethyl-8-ribityllumazine synthase
VARVQLDTGVPVGFGVLTTEDVAQATARSGPDAGNKGDEAAVGALETLLVLRALRTGDHRTR